MFKVKNSGRKLKNKKSVKKNDIGKEKPVKIKSHWDVKEIDKEKKMKIKKPKDIFENFTETKKPKTKKKIDNKKLVKP